MIYPASTDQPTIKWATASASSLAPFALMLLLSACSGAPDASCSSQLNTIKNQLDWNNPSNQIPPGARELLEQAEYALSQQDEAACLKFAAELEGMPGIR